MSDPGGPSGRDVFEILVREHADMLAAYLRSLIWTPSAVDDLFQETMLVAWTSLQQYDRDRPFGPWLRGIARNLVCEHQRRGKVRAWVDDLDVLNGLDERYDRLAIPGEIFRDRADRLLGCLARLPESMREAVELVYARGLLLRQIAQSVGASEESIKKRVQRARQLLARCLQTGEVTS